MRADEEIGIFGEVADLFVIEVVNLTRVIFQVQVFGAYPLGLNDTPNVIYFCTVLFS